MVCSDVLIKGAFVTFVHLLIFWTSTLWIWLCLVSV